MVAVPTKRLDAATGIYNYEALMTKRTMRIVPVPSRIGTSCVKCLRPVLNQLRINGVAVVDNPRNTTHEIPPHP